MQAEVLEDRIRTGDVGTSGIERAFQRTKAGELTEHEGLRTPVA